MGSITEIVNRMKLYFVSVYKIFIQRVKFEFGKVSSYYAENDTCDWTAEETRNLFDSSGGGGGASRQESSEAEPEVELESLKQAQVKQVVELESSKKEEEEPAARKKRDTSAAQQQQQLEDLHELRDLERCALDADACATRAPRTMLWGHEDARNDRLLLSYREHTCMPPVKRQGKCGSCYAFATLMLYEFQYCPQTGQSANFSVQYVIECGH